MATAEDMVRGGEGISPDVNRASRKQAVGGVVSSLPWQEPKYLNSSETLLYSKRKILFNLDKAQLPIMDEGYAILVEGQMDCIVLFEAGIRNVVAGSGTAFSEEQALLLWRYTDRVVLNYDSDEAGMNAANKAKELLTKFGFEVEVMWLEADTDPAAFIMERGIEAYRHWIPAFPKRPLLAGITADDVGKQIARYLNL